LPRLLTAGIGTMLPKPKPELCPQLAELTLSPERRWEPERG
jgi:hypothetical protein